MMLCDSNNGILIQWRYKKIKSETLQLYNELVRLAIRDDYDNALYISLYDAIQE